MASNYQQGGDPRRIKNLTYQLKPLKDAILYTTPLGLFTKNGKARFFHEPNISFIQTISEQEARLKDWLSK
jgi:hypothetical protein